MISDPELKLVAYNGRLLNDAEYMGIARELLARREADRWIPVGEGVIPAHEMLEVCIAKTKQADTCMFGSKTWEDIRPSHYRRIIFPEVAQ